VRLDHQDRSRKHEGSGQDKGDLRQQRAEVQMSTQQTKPDQTRRKNPASHLHNAMYLSRLVFELDNELVCPKRQYQTGNAASL
jgi:hypothetical protein